MTATEAAEFLADEVSQFPWLVSVGVGTPNGKETLYVYVKSSRHRELNSIRDGYLGFPVIIENTGKIVTKADISANRSRKNASSGRE